MVDNLNCNSLFYKGFNFANIILSSAYYLSERMINVKKIIPFNNVLTFDTDISEISAISLEHEIKKETDSISGVFYISGEYKMTVGSLENDKFSFELPFDIALGTDYNIDTLIVDIDDFRYELVGSNKLKVNIDLYIDGEVDTKEEKTEEPFFTEKEYRDLSSDINDDEIQEENNEETNEVTEFIKEEEKDNKEDEVKEIETVKRVDDFEIKNNGDEEMKEDKIDIDNNNENNNINIFNGFNEEEKYVTYHVYPVTENDTLDKILEKYNVTKEEFSKYNNSLDIHVGDKLIIPANNDK